MWVRKALAARNCFGVKFIPMIGASRTYVYYTDNMTEESLAKAEDDAMLDVYTSILQVRKEDAYWQLGDMRV
uniref:Uncharacterized protein n=1 Tax=Mycena chlorophos TaxID=658473 RepID=A0ABQ0M037_MYCCL|nr:predicted protein [Mycena chlorophos]